MLLFCNAQSIRNTWPVFKATASVYKPSILAVVETWLSDDISNHYIYHDYHLHAVSRNARISDPAGGGVALFFHPSYILTVKQVSVKPPLSCDTLAVVDTRDGHCWVIVYLPYPVADDTEQLCKYFDCIFSEHKSVTIIGDLNMNQIK